VLANIETTGDARKLRSEQRRQRILEAARDCFGEAGFAGATVTAVARRAGVSNGLLYQFFRNKEHMLAVVLEDVVRDWVRAMLPRDDQSAAEALEHMLRGSIDFCRSNPLLPALVNNEDTLQLHRFAAVTSNRVQPHRDLVASILRRGGESGEFRADLDVDSSADLICQLHGHYAGRAYQRDPLFPLTPELVDAAVRFIFEAVAAPAD
jgi:AcrR family transcriptional regulator